MIIHLFILHLTPKLTPEGVMGGQPEADPLTASGVKRSVIRLNAFYAITLLLIYISLYVYIY
jgi:hypothetical protein